MPLISDPLGQALVLAGVLVAALCAALAPTAQLHARINETAVLLASAAVLLLAAVLYLWAASPILLIAGAGVFFATALLVRPKGAAHCARFACGFLVAGLAWPIALFSARPLIMAAAVLACVGLALCLGGQRRSQVGAIGGAGLWLALHGVLPFQT